MIFFQSYLLLAVSLRGNFIVLQYQKCSKISLICELVIFPVVNSSCWQKEVNHFLSLSHRLLSELRKPLSHYTQGQRVGMGDVLKGNVRYW
jgi:hypothetical protein